MHEPAVPSVDRTSERAQMPRREYLTIEGFCREFEISRDTFYKWRAKKTAPACTKLPNGELRIARADLDAWIDTCREAA
ncbi:AlpA family transcriptional regulator [Saccharopolyspora sp. 6M]|uniref:helix-turn-helix transcriptional regulator n=1 Tax=Saccharopolyspora sp. 6M TaxID=2877237 RepID=UPI001CD429FB|nr:helix-turn-helix domain-containing protein [Saccharopolyspora sp. 6M]MCA1228460.1 helix-turn-helix domain-containing protein [Saccharopolyspora sp. 6M]